MVEVFGLVRELLADDGTLWLNIGDSYGHGTAASRQKGDALLGDSTSDARTIARNGLAAKQLVGIPWRVAFALQADGWYLRQDIIWSKPNPMPESVRDRCTKSHEYLFLLAKNEHYFYDADAIAEDATCDRKRGTHDYSHVPGGGDNSGLSHGEFSTRNKRSVWTVTTKPFYGAHFATFPPDLIEPCILAGSRPGDTVLDCFFGSGTTGEVAQRLGRQWIGIELNPAYEPLQQRRTAQQGMVLV